MNKTKKKERKKNTRTQFSFPSHNEKIIRKQIR